MKNIQNGSVLLCETKLLNPKALVRYVSPRSSLGIFSSPKICCLYHWSILKIINLYVLKSKIWACSLVSLFYCRESYYAEFTFYVSVLDIYFVLICYWSNVTSLISAISYWKIIKKTVTVYTNDGIIVCFRYCFVASF